MACIEHYIKDAENVFDEIVQNHKTAQDNAYTEFKAARTIQRTYRGFVVRKYLKHLNSCATTVQKYWRGYVDRKYYDQLLKETVYKKYWEYYNGMATRIQKVWRGHYVRTRVFSYYKLKEYIRNFLEMNKDFLEKAKRYEEYSRLKAEREMQEECQRHLQYLSGRVHHLLRTYQIEGIFSNHGTKELSRIEQMLAKVRFTEYMKLKHGEAKQKELETPQQNYIFEGRLRECEEVWLHRNDPGKYSLATGEYGEDERQHKLQQKIDNSLRTLQDKPSIQCKRGL